MNKERLLVPRCLPNLPPCAVIAPVATVRDGLCKAVVRIVDEQGDRSPFSKKLRIADAVSLAVFEQFVVAGPCIGGPLCALLCEHLFASGIKKLVLCGFAGGIKSAAKDITIGSLVFPSSVISEEMVSRLYGGEETEDLVCSKLQASIEEKINLRLAELSLGVSAVKGAVWSTDAPYLETVRKVQTFADREAIAVEMELAACARLAKVYDIEFAAVFIVSDILSDTWHPGFVHLRRSPVLPQVFEAIIETVMDIAKPS